MFQVIDAESRGLTETDGAEMAGDLEPMSMRGFDRRCELVRRNVHIGLERGCAFRDPIFDGAPGVFGVCELAHLRSERAFAFQVGPSDVNLWTGHFSLVDRQLEFEIRVRFDAASCANGSNTAGEVQAREACRVFRIERK